MGTDIHGYVQRRYEGERYENVAGIEDSRNYTVFAMLAGVRNRYGLAPIAEPRGLPSDLGKKDWESDNSEDDFGEHSFSWLTLPEIRDWPRWNESLHASGIVDREEYLRFKREGDTPRSYCQGIGGGKTVVVKESEAHEDDVTWTHVECTWTVPFRQYAETFRRWIEYLDSKHGWLLEGDPGAIRIVFGFDS